MAPVDSADSGVRLRGLQFREQIDTAGSCRRNQAEQDGGRQRKDQRETQHAAVQAEVHQPLDSVVAEQWELVQHVDILERHQNPRCAASQKEDAGFGEKVANQTFATGPCGRSYGHLLPSLRGTGEQEIGNVGARNEQYCTGDC